MNESELMNPDILEYLASQRLGRLATVDKDGAPQNSPVGFRINRELGTIDIGGWNLRQSRKFRNLARNDRVAFVVDDIASFDPWRVRMVEIRGRGEQVIGGTGNRSGMDDALIRVHPVRVIAFGVP
ncbi:PPOX class F420-dependent oxidoreductase [Gordonia sp. SL306]|uniref:PPOX class F420-dependent oxidoreductase n=1 Tax=Gordonia sp. SL306 TaxID=2995145 RepID=UPI00227099E1|nr:PPOX class F420-dependent oxidoreductase [Gordonia sp. SL306]WAC57008.1 PPOX class F420-dependent oxidoreductase [Gordonia sp. SL306]